MMFRFSHPVILVILAVVLAACLIWRFFRRKPSVGYSLTSFLAGITGKTGTIAARVPDGLRLLALILLILASARLQLTDMSREVLSPGVDIMLCLDTSGSMEAIDFELNNKPVTRLTAVKKVVSEFIAKRHYDRMGLVVFGKEAFTQAPLTMDKGLLLNLTEGLEIGMAGDSTAIGSALAVAGKRLKDLKAPSKVVILLTDGNSNAGDVTPKEAAEALKALSIKVYTIGVGGRGQAPFLVNTPFGRQLVYRQVDLNEEALREISAVTGGHYYLAANSEDLAKIYGVIDSLEKREVKTKEFFRYRELYLYFLIPAFILIMFEIVLRTTILRVLP